MRKFKYFMTAFTLLTLLSQLALVSVRADPDPEATLRVSLPAGTKVGPNPDPWLNEGWLLNITGTCGTFIVRINQTSECQASDETRLIIALNDEAYNNIISITVDSTEIPKTTFQYGTPTPYGTWTWPDGVYPTWFNDMYPLGTIPRKGYRDVTVSVEFSDPTNVRIHFDAYGRTICYNKIFWSPNSEDSTVWFHPEPLQPPHAEFTYSPPSPQVCETVTFDASLSYDPDGTIVSYTWNFGDGNTTTVSDVMITHHYEEPNCYTVNLTVTDNNCLTNSTTKCLTVRKDPVAAFTYSPIHPQVCEEIVFNASDSTPDGGCIISYEWNFGDCSPHEFGMIVTHHYEAAGNYIVTLNVTDSEGKWDTESKTVTVSAPQPPHAEFTWCPESPQVCEEVTFDASASTPNGGCIIKYEWDFGDCSPHEFGEKVTHHYTSFGTYTVTLNVTDSEGLWDTESKTITVRAHPHADFTYSPHSPKVCETVTFDGSSSTPDGGHIISYEWDFGDCSPHEFGVIITHCYSKGGSYTVTLNVTDSEGKWDIESTTITVSVCMPPPPKAQLAVLIEGERTWSWKEYTFNISDYCRTFQVEVWVLGPIEGYDVKDLYAYEFWLTFDPNWIELVDHEIKHIHTDDFIVLQEVNNTIGVYKQVVTALGPVKGFNGSTPVAVLHFHIKQVPCYPNDYVGELKLENTKMSDSCTNAIPHSLHDGYIAIHSKKPKISVQYQGQNKVTKWIVGENFTVDIVLIDVVNMRSFYMELEWCECLETSYQDVNVTDFLPPPYEIHEIDVSDTWLTVYIRISSDKPAVNGTGVVMRITFKVKNPWPCNIPEYTRINHEWKVEEYTCQIRIRSGYIDAYCPEYREMQFYDCNGLDVENLDYTFTPIPGDLNLDGHVDIVDLLWIAQNYGSTIEAFDFNHDGIVDLYDVVVVAKNYCRTKP